VVTQTWRLDAWTRKRRRAEHENCKVKKTNLTSAIIGGWIQWPNMQLLFKLQVNQMKIDNFRKSATLWPMLTSKRIGDWIQWLICKSSSKFKSIRWKLRILEISPKLLSFDLDDLLVHVVLKNNWLVEFIELKYKSTSSFRSIRLKLRISEISPKLWLLDDVDLLVDVDLKNNWLVEFSDLKYKSSSNFKSLGWKLGF